MWTRNHLAQLRDQTADTFKPPNPGRERIIDLWVNGNDYVRATKIFGLLPVTETTRKQYNMQSYLREYALREKIKHHYLARQQQTRFAILPVHTSEERGLYCLLAKQRNGFFDGPNQPNWLAVTVEWSRFADGKHIFYKVLVDFWL